MSEDRDTEQVSSTWLAQLRREYVIYGSECARLQKDLDSTKRMFENAVMTIATIGEAAGVRGEDQQNGHLEIVEAINKIKGRRAVYKAKVTELERELEVWRSGPVCWSCGDSGQVHSLDGEWRGECNCQGAVDARTIAALEGQVKVLQSDVNSWQSGYDKGRTDGSKHRQAELAVWYGQMPESNGKSNFTALLHRKSEGLMDGVTITLGRSEYPERVRYEADRVRHLIGELEDEPCILDYDADKHSGYAAPAPPAAGEPSVKMVQAACAAFRMDVSPVQAMHDALCAALAVAPSALAGKAYEIGIYGKAYDLPSKRRAYTYAEQPDNLTAYKLAKALVAAGRDSYGDGIDQGLSLLNRLQEAGFGVFELAAAPAPGGA